MVRICALMLLLLPIGCIDSASAPTTNEPGKVGSPDQLATGNAGGDVVAGSKTLLISVPGMT